MKAALLQRYDELLSESEWLVYEDVPEPAIEGENDVIVRIGGGRRMSNRPGHNKRSMAQVLQFEPATHTWA